MATTVGIKKQPLKPLSVHSDGSFYLPVTATDALGNPDRVDVTWNEKRKSAKIKANSKSGMRKLHLPGQHARSFVLTKLGKVMDAQPGKYYKMKKTRTGELTVYFDQPVNHEKSA